MTEKPAMGWIFCFAAAFAVMIFLLALFFLHAVFGSRCEGDPQLRYLTNENFDGLSAEPVSFSSSQGQTLRGAVYFRRDAGEFAGLVLFAHGMGGGHRSYMTEINTIASAGFAVLAYDNTGTMASEGKSLGSFYQAVRDLQAALAFLRKNSEWSRYPVVLAGHSWGGYAVCQALAYEEEHVAGAVVFSAPNSAAGAICDGARSMMGIEAGWLRPFFAAASIIRGGWASRHSSAAILAQTSHVPVLLLQGDADTSVRLPNSPLFREAVRQKKNITGVIYEDRAHNVYQTKESEQYLASTMEAINAAKKKYGKAGIPDLEKKQLYDIDYALITQEDPVVMKTVTDFMLACVNAETEKI